MKVAELPIKRMKVSDIRVDTYNPRKTIAPEYRQYIKQKMTDPGIGYLEPLVVNINHDRLNILISGHVRLGILQEEGYDEVDVSVVNVNIDTEKELNVAFNKVRAEFDPLKLIGIGKDILIKAGFTPIELKGIDKKDIEVDRPEVQFTTELLESHNYVVLYFDNEIDWLNLQSLYPLPTVKALDSKPGFEKRGIGRVVKGSDFIRKIKGET